MTQLTTPKKRTPAAINRELRERIRILEEENALLRGPCPSCGYIPPPNKVE